MILPISAYQLPFWSLHASGLSNAAHHVAVAARLRGYLEYAVLREALAALVRRHEALRVALSPPGAEPGQRVGEAGPVDLDIVTLEGIAEEEQERALAAQLVAGHQPLFDLTAGRPFRARLLRLDPRHHVLTLTAHHLVVDAHSMVVAFGELVTLYEDGVRGRPSDLAPPPLDYAGILALHQAAVAPAQLERQAQYWRSRLEGWSPGLDLPLDHPRPPRRHHRTASRPVVIAPALHAAIASLARDHRVSPASVVLGAWLALLAARTGREDVSVLSPLANRWRREHERLVGMFTNSIVLRALLPAGGSFGDLLGRLRATAMTDLANGAFPLARLDEVVPAARALRRLHPHRCDRVRFNLLPAASLRPLADRSLDVEPLDADFGAAGEDLHLMLRPAADRYDGWLHFDPDVFDASTAETLAEDYLALLTRVCAAPSEPLAATARHLAVPPPWRVAIAATFTAEPIAPSLAFWANELRLPTTVRFAPLDQVHQQLLDPAGELARASAAVILLRLGDWAGAPAFEATLDDLEAAIAVASGRSIPLLVVVCPSAPDHPHAERIARAEDRIAAIPTVTCVRSADLLARVGDAPWSDPDTDRLGRAPYTPAMEAVLGTAVARWLHTLRRPPLKVVVVDADETLWSGVVGEVGWRGVVVDPARRALQARLLALQERGVLLCVASKNHERDVLDVLEHHPDMLLRPAHFVATRIDWSPKCENVASLAAELGLGLDSFVFLDDNPVECGAMREALPEVLTLQVPGEPDALLRFVAAGWGLDPDPRPVTREDRERTELYRQAAAREALRRGATSLDAFLDGLGLEVTVAPLEEADLERAAQLTQRTNQFNLRVQRRTAADLRALPEAMERRVVRARDRFGDHGLVGLVIVEAGPASLVVDTFLLSCRVLGRGVEHRVLEALAGEADARGLAHLDLPCVYTDRNRPARDFLGDLLADRRQEAGIHWTRVATTAAVGLRPRAGSRDEVVEASGTRGGAAPSAAIQRAVGELARPERLVALLGGAPRGRTTSGTPPVTPTERRLAVLWADTLGIERACREDDFFADGGDSLHAVQLVARAGREWRVDLALETIFAHPTLSALATAIDRARSGAPVLAGVPTADLHLLDDLVVGRPAGRHGRILLTGATGALGAPLLAALLASREAPTVVCLVRAADAADARRRLALALADQRLSAAALDRVEVVLGDLEQPRFGLSEGAFVALGARLDAIFHNGARLGDLLPYGAVRAANVLGTASVLRLAAVCATPVHHVSTLAVLDPSAATEGEVLDEAFDPARSARLRGGYNQSKWVAEALVSAAGRRGVPVTVYRPGLIGGNSRTGAMPPGGAFARVLGALVRLGAYPPVRGVGLPLVAVDVCADAIVELAMRADGTGQVFHLCPAEPVALDWILDRVRAAGHPLHPVPLSVWRARVEASGEAGNLADVLAALGHGELPPAPRFGCARTLAVLRETSIRPPTISGEAMRAWVAAVSAPPRTAWEASPA